MLDDFNFNPPFPVPKIGFCQCHYYQEEYYEAVFDQFSVTKPSTLHQATLKRKSEFLAGRYCARLALINFVREEDLSKGIHISINPDRSPQWPPGIVGSITHSSDTAAAVISRASDYRGLGIDCETLLPDTEAFDIRDRILHEKDVRCKETTTMELGFLVTLAFSAKESLYKALYPATKKFLDFQDVYIKRINTNSITLTLDKTLNSIWPAGTDFEVLYSVHKNKILTFAYLQ